jgi:hypothetical protein
VCFHMCLCMYCMFGSIISKCYATKSIQENVLPNYVALLLASVRCFKIDIYSENILCNLCKQKCTAMLCCECFLFSFRQQSVFRNSYLYCRF